MHKILTDESDERNESQPESHGVIWTARTLGFLGSAVITWIVLRALAPTIASSWGIGWITNLWAKVGIVVVVSLVFAAVLSRIEGTIWGRYYVIIGYLLSFGLIVWVVLHLLNYV